MAMSELSRTSTGSSTQARPIEGSTQGHLGGRGVQGQPGGGNMVLQFIQHPIRTVKALLQRKVESAPPPPPRVVTTTVTTGLNSSQPSVSSTRHSQDHESASEGLYAKTPPQQPLPPSDTQPIESSHPDTTEPPESESESPYQLTQVDTKTETVHGSSDSARLQSDSTSKPIAQRQGNPGSKPSMESPTPGPTGKTPVLTARDKGEQMDREARAQGLVPKPPIAPKVQMLNEQLRSEGANLKPVEHRGAEGKAEVQDPDESEGLPPWARKEIAREQGLQAPKPLPKPQPQALARPFDLGAIPESQWQKGALTAKLQLAEEMLMPKPKGLDQLADNLGKQLAAQFSHLDPRHEMAMAFSSREQILLTVLDTLGEDVPGALPGNLQSLTKPQRQALDRVVDTMMKNLPTRMLDDKTILLHGKTYQLDKKMAEGHFGGVYAFKERDGTDVVAVKIAKPGQLTKEEIVGEARLLYEASQPRKGQAPDSLIKPLALLPTDKGDFWTVMPMHGKGTGRKIIDAIQVALSTGRISKQQAQAMQLTLIQDLLRAQAHLQSQVGIAHYDVRADNTLISDEGVLVLADLGLARDTRDPKATVAEKLPVRWTAPEAFGQEKKAPDPRSDSFMGGILANELLTGQLPPDVSDNMFWDSKERQMRLDTPTLVKQRQDKVKDGGQMLPNPNLEKNPLPGNASPTTQQQAKLGVTALDKLLNSLMHPDVNQRMNAETALQSGVFDAPGVGTPQTRALILQMLS